MGILLITKKPTKVEVWVGVTTCSLSLSMCIISTQIAIVYTFQDTTLCSWLNVASNWCGMSMRLKFMTCFVAMCLVSPSLIPTPSLGAIDE